MTSGPVKPLSYRVRKVDGSDKDTADTLFALHTLTFGSSAIQVPYDKGYWWIVEKDRAPIGFAGLSYSTYWPHSGYLKRSGVLPEHRGHGLQKRLLRVREAQARKLGWKRIITDTTDNVHSANNLIKSGYLMFAPRHPWGPHIETCYWKKDLS